MIDLAILGAFVAYSVTVGFRARRRASTGLSEYFLAGRSLRGWQAGLSMAASQFAADTPLLVMGMLAVGGVSSLWRLWIYGLAFLLMGLLLGGAWQRARVLTDAELTTVRYSARGAPTLRVIKAFYFGTIINCVVLAFVLVAAVRIFELFLPWHLWLPDTLYEPLLEAVRWSGLRVSSMLPALPAAVATTNNLISIVCTLTFVALYSTTGGLRSVVSTDVVQLALMLLGTAAYAWLAVGAAGGMSATLTTLEHHYGPDAERLLSFAPMGEAVTAFLVVISLQWLFQLNSDGTGYLAQRVMACADEREARVASVVFTFTQVVVRSLLWLIIGVALLALFPPAGDLTGEALVAERELLFARGIDELLPPGLRGLMLTAMLAALASTLDTHLNWGAGYWANDLYKDWWLARVRKRAPGPRELVVVARLSSLLLIGIALAIMTHLESIQSAWHLSLLFGAGMGSVLVLRWLWERINLYCELLAILTSIVVAPLLLIFVDEEWLRLALMAATSTAAVVAAALLLPVTQPERLVAFYRQVRPPGWWGETAVRAGESPQVPRERLVRAAMAIAACAVSVYGTLVGCAQIALRTADFGTALLLLAALVAVPVWLRFVRSGSSPSADPSASGR